jgi:hypothetical protein
MPSLTPTMPQYSSSIFVITLKDLTNNQYNCWDKLSCLAPIIAKHKNPSQQVKKTLPNGKLKMTHERGTCGLRF